ncbi:MAG: glycosyltransferase [Prevotella sp.]
MIQIGLCTDNRYAMPCGVCVTSLLENNKDEEITVYVLEKGLTDENRKKFDRLAADYGQKDRADTCGRRHLQRLSHNTPVPALYLL